MRCGTPVLCEPWGLLVEDQTCATSHARRWMRGHLLGGWPFEWSLLFLRAADGSQRVGCLVILWGG